MRCTPQVISAYNKLYLVGAQELEHPFKSIFSKYNACTFFQLGTGWYFETLVLICQYVCKL